MPPLSVVTANYSKMALDAAGGKGIRRNVHDPDRLNNNKCSTVHSSEDIGDKSITRIDGSRVEDDEDDPEIAELAKLRCPSLQTEEVADRQRQKEASRERRRNRCADYPGLAFGSPMFGSDTMMKFNIIKNELHNIMRSQLRRVDGEVSALAQRIREVDADLEKSEQYIKTATSALAEAVEQQQAEQRQDSREENALSEFDAQMRLLEGKLEQARGLVEESRTWDVQRE